MTVNLVRSISPISPISASSFLRFVGLSFEDAARGARRLVGVGAAGWRRGDR